MPDWTGYRRPTLHPETKILSAYIFDSASCQFVRNRQIQEVYINSNRFSIPVVEKANATFERAGSSLVVLTLRELLPVATRCTPLNVRRLIAW